MKPGLDTARAFVEAHLCKGERTILPSASSPRGGDVVVQDHLFSFELDSPNGRELAHVYFIGSELGRDLWERASMSLGALPRRQHPALPRHIELHVHRPHHESDTTWAYTRVPLPLSTLADPHHFAIVSNAAHRAQMVRCVGLLADALALLHRIGVLHLNIHPETVIVRHFRLEDTESARGEQFELVLGRFEMSAMVSNLLRRRQGRTDEVAESLRAAFRTQGPSALVAAAPERLQLLFPDASCWSANRVEVPATDVYGLGMLLVRLLGCGPTDDEVRRAFPGKGFDPAGWEALHQNVQSRLFRLKDVPDTVRAIATHMIDENPSQRPTAWEAWEDLRKASIDAEVHGRRDPEVPYRIAFLDEYFRDTLLHPKWQLLPADASNTAEAIRAFIAEDLEGGHLVHAPFGYTELRPRAPVEARQELGAAVWVLQGRRCDYFTRPYFREARLGRTYFPQALMIRYVFIHGGVERRRYTTSEVRVRLPRTKVAHVTWSGFEPSSLASAPSWQPLLALLRTDVQVPEHQTQLARALEWYLRFVEAALAVRHYAVRISTENGQLVFSRDAARDDAWLQRDGLRHVIGRRSTFRPAFEEFFPDGRDRDPTLAESDGGGMQVRWVPDHDGAPDWESKTYGKGRVVRAEYLRVYVEPTDRVSAVPTTGWLAPADDDGVSVQMWRQKDASRRLLESHRLVDELMMPQAAKAEYQPAWNHAGRRFEHESKGFDLGEDTRRTLRALLSAQGLFAVQGPPGTGKSTLVTAALLDLFHREPGARVLVTAQSHYALDALAEKLLTLPALKGVTKVRVASKETDSRVRPEVARYLPGRRSLAIREELSARAGGFASVRSAFTDAQREVLRAWRDAAASASGAGGALVPEIEDRMRRSANLVFATTGSATAKNVGADTEISIFDRVVVEEAAKAWLTELAIPMVLGRRWTLIGDPQQLSAFRLDEVLQVLADCASDPSPEMQEHARNAGKYAEVFGFFERLIRGLGDGHAQRLGTQHRMHPDIARVVSNAFYRGGLASGAGTDRPHRLEGVPELVNRALLWIDTSAMPRGKEEPCWSNRGEAALVVELLARIGHPLPPVDHEPRVAVLVPYHDQRRTLERALGRRFGVSVDTADLVHTVDSFQGKERDVVILSLVRTHTVRATTRRAAYGHLLSANRVNVAMSRARKLLVIVGEYPHYQDVLDLPLDLAHSKPEEEASEPGAFWQSICRDMSGCRRAWNRVLPKWEPASEADE